MANSDIIKIGFDYRASLAQFEKETNGVFDGISNKAGKQKITIQLDAKDDKIIDKIKKLQKLKLDKFTFEFGDSGLKEQLQTFDKLENKINDIINLGKGIGSAINGAGNSIVDEKYLKTVIDLFSKIENHTSTIKKAFSDVGDGEELSPLLKTISNIESAIDKLSSSVKGIGLNMNIDFGSDAEMEAKAQAKISNALQAYQNLFNHIKMSSAGGSLITQKFFDFDINQFDTPMSKLQAYVKFIKDMREETKQMFGGQDVLKNDTDAKYWIQVGQVTKVFNEMKTASDVNPLENIFGKTDLSSVIEQLNTIVSKLDEISVSAKGFTETFKNGLNINASVEEIEKLTNRVKELESELAKIKTPTTLPSNESNISSGSTLAIDQQNKLQEELKETQQQAEKTRQSISELVKGRDVVSQNWYREKGTVIGKDSKGNDITRDADEFSFVERLKNGQLQTVLATYNEETGKWAEQVINVRTAFEQVEKAIISADNKIASLKMTRDKTLAAHPGYDTTGDNNQIAIEQKRRNELQKTLNLYGSEKEYVFEIEAATKRIADNQERLRNKSQSQNNLQSEKDNESIYNKQLKAVKKIAAQKKKVQDADRKTEVDIALKNQLTEYKEIQNIRLKISQTNDTSLLSELERQKKIYQEQYLASTKILKNNSDLYNSEKRLNELKQIGLKTTLKIAENQAKENTSKIDATNAADVKSIQAEWDKNIKVIQDYMDAVTKLNNLKAKDKGTGSEANQIELQTENVEKLKQAAWEARQNLSSMQAENPDIIALKQWDDMMELFYQASKGSAESVAKLKDALDNIKAPSLDKYENKLSSYLNKTDGYDTTIARLEDGGWSSPEYLKNVQKVKDAVKEYDDLLNKIKTEQGGIASDEDIQKLKEYEDEIKNTISTVTNMSAAEKGYNAVSGQKELDKIHKILNENTKMSAKAKAQIKAFYK